jgi:hypothetical protein
VYHCARPALATYQEFSFLTEPPTCIATLSSATGLKLASPAVTIVIRPLHSEPTARGRGVAQSGPVGGRFEMLRAGSFARLENAGLQDDVS